MPRSERIDVGPAPIPPPGPGPSGKPKIETEERRRHRQESARRLLREIDEIPDAPDDAPD